MRATGILSGRLRIPSLAVGMSVAIAMSASWVEAHDFFLVPGAFPFAAGTDVVILGQTSARFPVSVAPVALARIATAVIIGADGTQRITDLSHRGTSLLLRTRPVGAGQRIISVSLVPRSTTQTGEGFLRWLKLEGASDAASHIIRDGQVTAADSIVRTDWRRAKTLVEVGTAGPRAYNRVSNDGLEFTPQEDPSSLRPGDSITFQVSSKGQGIKDLSVRAGTEAPADTTVRGDPDVLLRSDSAGRVRMAVTKSGLWNIRAVHVVQSGPHAWETHWATFVFRVGGR